MLERIPEQENKMLKYSNYFFVSSKSSQFISPHCCILCTLPGSSEQIIFYVWEI